MFTYAMILYRWSLSYIECIFLLHFNFYLCYLRHSFWLLDFGRFKLSSVCVKDFLQLRLFFSEGLFIEMSSLRLRIRNYNRSQREESSVWRIVDVYIFFQRLFLFGEKSSFALFYLEFIVIIIQFRLGRDYSRRH